MMAGSCCVVAVLLAVVCTQAGADESFIAECVVDASTGSGAENISGIVVIMQPVIQSIHKVVITVKLSGFKKGIKVKHGFHVHEHGSLGNSCKAAGGHFNPHNKSHAAPSDGERHVGDLGNVVQNKDGVVDTIIKDTVVNLKGKYSVVGKSIVIHEGEDDLGRGSFPDSKTTGHAGARLGCCIIVEVNKISYRSAASCLSVHTGVVLVAALGCVWRYFSHE